MASSPPAPQQLYIPPTPPPPPAPAVQPPQGTPGQFANQSANVGTPSFMALAAPGPGSTGQRSLLGT